MFPSLEFLTRLVSGVQHIGQILTTQEWGPALNILQTSGGKWSRQSIHTSSNFPCASPNRNRPCKMCRQRQFASTQTQKSQNLSQVVLLLLPSTLKDQLIMPRLWNCRENVKYFRPAFNPSIFTHLRGVRARKLVAFGSLHQEPREREMPLKRDADLTAQWRKRDAIVFGALPQLTTALTSQACAKCQAQQHWQHFGYSIFKNWSGSALQKNITRLRIKYCSAFLLTPSCVELFFDLFSLQKNCLCTMLSPSLLILTASHVPTHTLHQKST